MSRRARAGRARQRLRGLAVDFGPLRSSRDFRLLWWGELVDGEVWGRGAVDMLNLTASMAVATRHLADEGFRPEGTLVYLAVADEEALGTWGANWLVEREPDAVHSTRVRPADTSTEPSANSVKSRSNVSGRRSSGWRPSRRISVPPVGLRPTPIAARRAGARAVGLPCSLHSHLRPRR